MHKTKIEAFAMSTFHILTRVNAGSTCSAVDIQYTPDIKPTYHSFKERHDTENLQNVKMLIT